METKQIKRCLITGAFGLVGSTICKILERDYPEIEITKVKHTEYLSGHYLDIKYQNESFDFVIYASGYGQPIRFSQDKIETIKTACGWPLEGAFRLAKKEGKFLYISTSEVYSGVPSPHTEDMIGTTTPQHPRACYIEGKRCGEAICMAYKEQGYDVKIARLALAYGPGTKKGDTRVINQFIEQALTTGEIRMKDTGEAMRTYLYVDDAAQMILDVLFEGKEVVYNIGGQSRISIRSLAEWISTLTNSNILYGESSLKGSPDDVYLNTDRFMKEFPQALISMSEGLKITIEYQKKIYGITN